MLCINNFWQIIYTHIYFMDNNNCKLETITQSSIMKDVKQNFISSTMFSLRCAIGPIIILLFVLILTLSLFPFILRKYLTIIILLLLSVTVFIFLYSFIDYFRIFCSVKKNGIVIIKDNVKTTQSAQNPIDNPFFRSTYTYFLQKPYVIEFNKYGKYKIPRGYNYKFCLNKMLDKNIYESTSLGDEFYLAVTKENKIAIVYNTKFFYYAEK